MLPPRDEGGAIPQYAVDLKATTPDPVGEVAFTITAAPVIWRLITGWLSQLASPDPYADSASTAEQEAAAEALMSISPPIPIGTIVQTIRTTPPDNTWLLCDGSGPYNSVDGYGELVDAAPSVWRIDPATGRETTGSVWLPDLRGRVPVGQGAGAGLTNRVMGAKAGEESHLMTNAELLPHSHVMTHTHTYNYPTILAGIALAPGELPVLVPPVVATPSITSSTGSLRTSNQGGGNPFNVMQPYLVVGYMIKAKS